MRTLNPLTLSRRELYDLVWSKPMTEVAKSIGLSDVAVAKRCRQVQVPVPPRGYWARVAAGQTPTKPPLPKYRDSSSSIKRARGAPDSRTEEIEQLRKHSSIMSPETFDRTPGGAEPTVTFYGARTRVVDEDSGASPDLDPPHPLQAALQGRLAVLPTPPDAPESWLLLEDTTPPGWPEDLLTTARLPEIAAHSKGSELRARRIATQLIHVVREIGWRFVPRTPVPSEPTYYRRSYETPEEAALRSAHFLIEGERLFISVTERQMRIERPLTPEEQKEQRKNPSMFYYRDRYRYVPSGELTLRVSRTSGSGGFTSFRDTKRRPLERRIADVVRDLLQGALDIKRERKEAEEAAERRRNEELRQQRVREAREAHRLLIARLEAEAGAWERAQRLRRYLRAARRSLPAGARLEVSLQDTRVDLLSFGEEFANQLDPLHPAVRAGFLLNRDDPYGIGVTYGSDETKLQKFVSRLLGGAWAHTRKHREASEKSEA